jgi:hypothetical protein
MRLVSGLPTPTQFGFGANPLQGFGFYHLLFTSRTICVLPTSSMEFLASEVHNHGNDF